MNSPNLTAINIALFIDQQQSLAGTNAVADFSRLNDEQIEHPDSHLVNWRIEGEKRTLKGTGKQQQKWLHLTAQTDLIVPCQRCLQPLPLKVAAKRSFRFVYTEQQQIADDEIYDEDILVLTNEFDLHSLIEDELLLAIPLICKHEHCTSALPTAAATADFTAGEQQSPFAVLSQLKKSN